MSRMKDGDGRLAELARLFGRLGVTAFGGPAAHIAMMHGEVVTRRGWLTDQRFLDLLGVTNLIPGPNSTEMAMHVGHERAGRRGLVVAGASFILPAAVIVLCLAWAYERYGTTPTGEDLLLGIKPVVVVIVIQALLKLAPAALRSWPTTVVAVAAAAGYLVGVHELAVLFGGALLVLAIDAARRGAEKGATLLVLPFGGFLRAPGEITETIGLGQLLLVFLKAGAFLYGSGYVLLAFLQNDLVGRLHVLTDQQLLDAIAIGQFTPGPVFTTATFIGYVLAGFPGAVVATIGIFLPGFFFVGLINPIARRIRDRRTTATLLDGVNASALGLMAGVTAQLGRDAIADPVLFTAAIALVAGAVLWRTSINSAWLILGGAVVGIAGGAIGVTT